MKVIAAILVAGVAVGLLLGPFGGRSRRAHIAERLELLRRRATRAKDRVAQSETVQDTTGAASSSLVGTLRRVADGVQGRIHDAAMARGASPSANGTPAR